MTRPSASASSSASLAAPAVTALDPETLQTWFQEHKDLVVIDVRSAAEFESLHIRGSYNVPLPLLSEHTDELATRLGSRVVLVCQSGARAEQARQRLGGAGIGTAYVLTGGVPGFAAAGGNVVRGKARWDLERQVRLAAGSLVVLGLAGGKFVSPKIRLLAGAIGTGLTFSAATNTCAMGQALSAMPWNKAAKEPTRESAILQLPTAALQTDQDRAQAA
ncbi:rhodanese-related sulfurtransferase [Arthrobacter sp. PvP102]|jgi:rhodanese-related sulfurtransferase|uniref:rhodanese-like domain-containing protein n=1 Tax=unclassified Arthrobacter TaxID=235627 RepID=UPI00005271E1|nr:MULTISPECIES: rhodanese-like domain-containing protein [unclassified Arthrobacter]ABK05208.1 Rhodanese domain protein [Arthrobacter sp. FB24]MBP1233226.1 rhodanese-related sulfurtransferase [Arthrobacter sp. PvP103]MBP1238361.1 rhodanese-related sulfurtransferase [Arthrobacter sp. PvP102]